jgi:hypothetical protein
MSCALYIATLGLGSSSSVYPMMISVESMLERIEYYKHIREIVFI